MRIIYLIFLSLLITSCNTTFKQKIGLETKGPNEYLVEKTSALEVPPHFNLPVPGDIQRGTRSNSKIQNKTKINSAEQALINDLDL